MAADTVSFASAVTEAKKLRQPLSILLGNGFSRSFSEAFAYSKLRDIAPMNGLTVSKHELFKHASSDDFETVIHNLEQSARLVDLYEPHKAALSKAMRDDAELVKQGLVDALTLNHPASATAIEATRYTSAREFLSHFSRIFSLNYDLLLYWAIQQTSLGPPNVVRKDGFGRPSGDSLIWSLPDRPDEQEVFYLHGAMHLYVDDGVLKKLEVANGRIVKQLKTNLESGKYPLVVTEGSSVNKQARIARSAYLTYYYTRLSRLRGVLFIHGMAMSENDDHILRAVANGSGRIDALYIGLYNEPSLDCGIIRARANEIVRVRKERTGRTIRLGFYGAETTGAWG